MSQQSKDRKGTGVRAGPEKPVWNGVQRELRLGGKLVKRFGQSAGNQECIIEEFQRLGWPEGIKDPLPDTKGINRQLRLGETIRGLNGHQKEAKIRFRRTGVKDRIVWEIPD